jgi:UDP-N-acetylmuramoyl-tripeptide--D-alanyl-D-alanine ligase
MSLWSWTDIVRAAEGRGSIEAGPDISGIVIDSRLASAGDLFIALTGDPGPRFNAGYRSDRDGHDFVVAAAGNGAVAALVHRPVQVDVPQIQVADTLDGLWSIGRAARARFHQPVVAVTGSSGKTTCKAMLQAALHGFATQGSLNNHLGVPLSLARTPSTATYAIYEIGTNHPGEIGPLSQLVQPDVAIVLNVHPAHAENFASRADIEKEKLSISNGLTPGSTLIVEESLAPPDGHWRIVRFGTGPSSDVQLVEHQGERAVYEVFGERLTASIPGGGGHRAMTLAAVLAACKVLDADFDSALHMDDEIVPAGRGTTITAGGVTLVDDSYNANPASMRASLETFQAQPASRHIAVLGEMLELGDASVEHHRDLASACGGLDAVFCVGDGMRALHEALSSEQQAGHFMVADETLLSALRAFVNDGDRVLIKGSNRVFWTRGFTKSLAAQLDQTQKM